MSAPNSDFLRIAKERGYIHQTTDEAALDAALLKGGLTAYIGYDCTADSLHVGHLMPTMLLRLLQKTGGTYELTGEYNDDLVRRGGEWLFLRRVYLVKRETLPG